MTKIAVHLRAIRKTFGSFVALDDVSFDSAFGEVHALLGENGAGKSSLMNVLAGLYAPDAGDILIAGQNHRFSGPLDAVAAGIGMIHQHFKLVDKFTVLENVLLSVSASGRRTSPATLADELRTVAARLKSPIDPDRNVGSLSIAEKQRVEIARTLVLGSRILILDEPTAVLTEQEAATLYDTLRGLAANGVCVIIVTHKLGDVRAVADRATIMRQGRLVATVDAKTTSAAELTALAVGSEVPTPTRSQKPSGDVILQVQRLGTRSGSRVNLSDASFELRAGEIYGIAGIGGNGQTELVDVLAGMGAAATGRVVLRSGQSGERDVTSVGPATMQALGISTIPADRHGCALASRLSVQDNFAVAHLATRTGSWFRVNQKAVREMAAEAVRNSDVQGVRSLRQRIGLLSGGNAQKLVVARELSRSPRILVAHSPCRGLDVRASANVHARLIEARDRGVAVLLISEDLDEVMAISDRIGVMSAGRIDSEFSAPFNRADIGEAMVNHQ